MKDQVIYRIDKHFCGKITCVGFGTLTEFNKKFDTDSKSMKTLVKNLCSNGSYSFVRIGKREDLCEGDLVTVDGTRYTDYALE
jgi:ethanolamine ammonia-lyase large subunit